MTSKKITIQTCPQTNRTKSVTNRFKQNKQRCHRPTRSTRKKQTNKTNTLTTNPLESNCTQQCNTLSLCKPSSSSNCTEQRNQSKRITNQQEEKQNCYPKSCCFSSVSRERSPCSGRTICLKTSEKKCVISLPESLFLGALSTIEVLLSTAEERTSVFCTPFQMNTFQSLCIPKTKHRFLKTRGSTIPCLSMRMILGMISSLDQEHERDCQKKRISTLDCSCKRQMQTHQRHTVPCFNSRCNKKTKILSHSAPGRCWMLPQFAECFLSKGQCIQDFRMGTGLWRKRCSRSLSRSKVEERCSLQSWGTMFSTKLRNDAPVSKSFGKNTSDRAWTYTIERMKSFWSFRVYHSATLASISWFLFWRKELSIFKEKQHIRFHKIYKHVFSNEKIKNIFLFSQYRGVVTSWGSWSQDDSSNLSAAPFFSVGSLSQCIAMQTRTSSVLDRKSEGEHLQCC